MKYFKTIGLTFFTLVMNIAFYWHIFTEGIEEDLLFWVLGMLLLGFAFIGSVYHSFKTLTKTW